MLNRLGLAACTLALTFFFGNAWAEVASFEILSRQPAALGGRAFGSSGTAEKITARATIALDPADPRNAVIADPIDMPPNVRLYMPAGAPHGNSWNATVHRSPACAMPLNPIGGAAALRALLTALNRWIAEGVEPPASRYPSLAQGTLVPAATVYPVPIPALGYHGQYARAQHIEQTAPLPTVRGEYPIFLPRAGVDGNAIAGLRLPLLAAPRATYTGWNPIPDEAGEQGLCTQMGSTIPFAAARQGRLAAQDPRPSLEELYPAPAAYQAAVAVAARRLVAERLLLPTDADAAVQAAADGTLAKFAP